jgi:hypothetical protein
MTIDPVSKRSNQNSNFKREENTLIGDQSNKTHNPNEREYGLLEDKIVLPEDFTEFDLEIKKLFCGEDKNKSFNG